MTGLIKLDPSKHIETSGDVRAYLSAASEGGDAAHIAGAVDDVMSSPWAAPTLNTSGFNPLDVRVLVMPDAVEEKTKGGIIIPTATIDQKKMAMLKGTLVAVGANAWEEAASRSPAFIRPQPGDRVLIAKYGGIELTGDDGVDYRLMNDTDVIGTLEGVT